ncbi:MAG: aminotransferase class V-fold PLP-dependent enzyme, partial [Lachnospiraceae bacterium]|nr:aminotransferase class V-fold PLP-dependent enzyme [Lachnospiraceae bacterium]
DPVLFGGGQEKGVRPGTLNVPGIVGFGVAASEAALRLRSGGEEQLSKLRDYLLDKIEEALPEAVLNGKRTGRLPGNINISLPGADSSSLVIMLDAAGICVSGGSACSNISGKGSHVLRAMGLDEKRVNGALRITLSHLNTKEEADRFLAALARIAEGLRKNRII